MRLIRKFMWPVIGLAAIVFSLNALYDEVQGLSFAEFVARFEAVPLSAWLCAIGATLFAYAALAAYDHLALAHLGHRISLWFITLCSFTTYAISHTVGASVFSGAVIRYRAYASKGLTPGEIGVLVAFCSFTFALGTVMLVAIVLLLKPGVIDRFIPFLPEGASVVAGVLILMLVGLYVAGSLIGFRPVKTRWFQLHYPRPSLVFRQLVIAPAELIAAASIIYFALPAAGNPGFVVILGIFLASFSVALLSHAPGGIGVLEFVFIAALPEMDPAAVLAALAIFRLLYLIVPFLVALVIIVLFERHRFLSESDETPA
ncbi:lysylphosphatidylglycerol synthase transmembrane domain-containing protein [Ensifer soli]|uniref:lysylphosphatidylglycerol synthase transmembrane domain-containing protein n=1 Tax=Ciceribacter sp. sgz301302 TaxID=3342379 RepID=UPI0035B76571